MQSIKGGDLLSSEGAGGKLRQIDRAIPLAEYVEVLARQRSSYWAWQNYEAVLRDLLRIQNARRVMEIGAGRSPLFDRAEIALSGIDYIANDVDPTELARAPQSVSTACFDISTTDRNDIKHLSNTMDLIFSKMVFEHISDTNQAYINIYDMLSSGGTCLNFHPVLFSLPFVVNYLTPTATAEKILRKLSPKRHREDQPKFPARYDRCYISQFRRSSLQSIGYRQVWQLPFWFHEYFKKIPGIRECDWALNKVAERANWTTLASYCFTIVVK